ncbi:asparaginyl-tRNA synthetase [Grosmannia clavigera kw1407]|uniref:asparagine--tRNA ligase n=1 Tax=Grosmannia clavigera (strain kw1407 / UAMH 11150) TaxID=655863 RepID=F0XFZ9_GROCL|nr:asparaginyl-tRNA synthetase [Grosmannia clavigera kw1407]EFX03355.1 asparaginyl-tRNA synthetase [Grosmannia clavigera kw1407]
MRAPLLPLLRTRSSLGSAAVGAANTRVSAYALAVGHRQRRSCIASLLSAVPDSNRSFSLSQPCRVDDGLQAPLPSSSSLLPTSVAGFLVWKPADPVADVAVNGFVRSVRSMKSNTFVTLGDGSSLAPLQAVVPADLADGLANGAAVCLKGSWVPSPGVGQSHELHVRSVDILGPSDAKKYQTPEFLRTLPHLRPRVPFNSTLLRLRSNVISSLDRFFTSRDFVQTHPPLITSSDCEGAGEVFTVSAASSASSSSSSSSNSPSKSGDAHFFRSPKYLTVSTQLHLEALAQAVGSVWTLSPTFRAEESDTPRHLSEFYMLEAEVCFVDRLDGVMDLVEDMLRAVAADVQGNRVADELLARPGGSSTDDLAHRWQGLVQQDRWPRITYAEALRILAAAPGRFDFAPTWATGLQTEHEKYLAYAVGGGQTPVFVTHYPRDIKAFYMLPSRDNAGEPGELPAVSDGQQPVSAATVDCFDLLVPEFCEIAGGSMREHRLPELVAAMRSRGMQVAEDGAPSGQDGSSSSDLDWYVDLRRWGCPPHGGFGVGFDRLLCYLSGVQTIRDTVAFPRWFGRCDC